MTKRDGIVVGFVGFQAIACAILLIGIASHWWPLGVRGEWEWERGWFDPAPWDILTGLTVSVGYAGFAALGLCVLRKRGGWVRESLAVLGLAIAALLAQAGWMSAAPQSFGFERWALVTMFSGPSGYYAKASRIERLDLFLRDYPAWIKTQDVLHTGTHPPGLFVACYGARRLMETHPDWALAIAGNLPSEVRLGFEAYDSAENQVSPPSDRAAVALIGLLTLAASALTVAPLYLLARLSLKSPTQAWFAAVFWPTAPASLLFQPVADTFYPLIAVSALALVAWATRSQEKAVPWIAAFGAGLILAVGMGLTLAFLAVGLIAGILEVFSPSSTPDPGRGWKRRIGLLAATGLGFLLLVLATQWATGFDPWRTWLANQANHARFYQEYPRRYWPWVGVNLIELAVALGLPATLWALAGFRRAGREAIATACVLLLLNFSGRNLGEAARLWLPLMPPLLLAVGAGADRLKAGPRTLAASLVLAGVMVVALEALIQGVYPAEAFLELKRSLPSGP